MLTRRPTRSIRIGNVAVGGGAPVSLQSMTNTDTRNVPATLAQIRTLARLGCELIRVAVPDMRAAEALAPISAESPIPVIADIHFGLCEGIKKTRIVDIDFLHFADTPDTFCIITQLHYHSCIFHILEILRHLIPPGTDYFSKFAHIRFERHTPGYDCQQFFEFTSHCRRHVRKHRNIIFKCLTDNLTQFSVKTSIF